MCEVCKRAECHPFCPNYEAKQPSRRRICVLCGEEKNGQKQIYQLHGFPYCEDCLLQTDAETIVRICEISKKEFFNRVGFQDVKNNFEKEDL